MRIFRCAECDHRMRWHGTACGYCQHRRSFGQSANIYYMAGALVAYTAVIAATLA